MKTHGVYAIFASLLAAITLLSGCATGFPRTSYDPKQQITQLETEFNKPELVTNYFHVATETERRGIRDKIITGRLTLMNLNYNQFVAGFSVTKQTLDASTEITELGLNLATTAVGGAGPKTVLAAISAGVTGSKLALDKNFFFEKTVPVLVTSMNAQRKLALAPILIGMTNSTLVYPLPQALSDLDAYYFAGTFIGALQAIQADAGAKEKVAETNLTFIRNAEFETTAVQARLDVLLDKIDALPRAAAIELEKNPPVANAQVAAILAAQDPDGKRLKDADDVNKDGKVTKRALKMRVILRGEHAAEELTTWEAAVAAAK